MIKLSSTELRQRFAFLKNIKGLIIFMILSVAVVGLWKLISLDDILNKPFQQIQAFLISIQAPATDFIVRHVFLIPTTFQADTLYFENGQGLQEQPLCTALKQVIQFAIILLIYPGPWKHKLWYIPFAGIILLISAIFHLVILAVTLALYPEHYMFMHNYISRWFFFGIYFLLWFFWEEKIVSRSGIINNNKK